MNYNKAKQYTIRVLLPCLLIMAFVKVNAQKDHELIGLVRNVTVSFTDSTIKAKALDATPKNKVANDVEYFWYYNNQVKSNVGGFYGKLLHGKYMVFNTSNNLITAGDFLYGAKSGIWKYWYSNGKLKASAPYKNGKLNGEVMYFSAMGAKTRTVEYKNGLIDGKEILYLADTTIVHKFNQGQLVEKKKKTAPETQKKPKNKSNAESTLEMVNGTPADSTAQPQSKNSLFKRIFKSKK
jgi:hypothetical protein